MFRANGNGSASNQSVPYVVEWNNQDGLLAFVRLEVVAALNTSVVSQFRGASFVIRLPQS
jgi:hypothetical protein